MLPSNFRFIWPCSFRGEDFKNSANQKQELPVAAMFVNGSGSNVQSLERTFHRCFLLSFGSFVQAVSEIFFKSTNNKKEFPVAAMFVNRSGEMCNLYRGPCIDASYQVSVHLVKHFQRRRFKKIDQSKARIACGGHVC